MVMEQIIGLAVIAESMTWAGPVQWIKQRIFKRLWRRIGPPPLLVELFDCSMCMGFWIGLFAFGSLYEAGLTMLAAKLIESLYVALPIKISLK